MSMTRDLTDFLRYYGSSIELTCFHQREVTCVKFGVQIPNQYHPKDGENLKNQTQIAEIKVYRLFNGSEGDPRSCYYSFVQKNIEYAFYCFLKKEVLIDSQHSIKVNPDNPFEHTWELQYEKYPTKFIGSYHTSQRKMYAAIGDGDWSQATSKAKEILASHSAIIPSLISSCVDGTEKSDWIPSERVSREAQSEELRHLLEVLIYNALYSSRRTPDNIQKALIKTFGKYSLNRFHLCLNFWLLLDLWGNRRASTFLAAVKDMSLLDKSKEDNELTTITFGGISFASTFVGITRLNNLIESSGLAKSTKVNVKKWLTEKLSEVLSNLSHSQWKGGFQGLDLVDEVLGHPFQICKLVEKAEAEDEILEKNRSAQRLQKTIEDIRLRETEDNCKVQIISKSKGTSQSIGEYQIDLLKKRTEKS